MSGRSLGLSRRELEREMAWLLRRLPEDPAKVPEALAAAVVALIDKNNAALAADLGHPPTELPGDL